MNIWNWFVETTAGWSTLGVVFRLLSALIVGLTVGIDREMKRRGAGIKTHVLVCLGAALVMITSQYLMENFDGSTDISRMGAQVISGVGFLGVGTIIVTGRNQVRGLTTAASLWVCACVGLAAGAGYIVGVLITLALLIFTLRISASWTLWFIAMPRFLIYIWNLSTIRGLRSLSKKCGKNVTRYLCCKSEKAMSMRGRTQW